MTDNKKKRLSMLDNLAAASSAAPTTSMMSTNRALRSARDAVDSHHVWDLDPRDIEDTRISDRLDPSDVLDLQDAIEANGQTVPILVRRHPQKPDRYLLVYGRRRLEAIRRSDKVDKVRALVASLDDDAAVRAQISENMARRDLSFIEKALFARELIENGFGNQTQVAEVLTVTKSSVSMALAIIETIGVDLATAIGPAQGVGRPRWEALAKAVEYRPSVVEDLVKLAHETRNKLEVVHLTEEPAGPSVDPSVAAFDAVMAAAELPPEKAQPKAPKPAPSNATKTLVINGKRTASLRRSGSGLRLDIKDGPFADWLEEQAEEVLEDLHVRWLRTTDDEG